MIYITNTSNVSLVKDPAIGLFITNRIMEITQGEICQFEAYGKFILVEPRDSLPDVEAALGRPFMGNFEWIVEHDCCYEAVFILSDDGFGIVLLIPKLTEPNEERIDEELITQGNQGT